MNVTIADLQAQNVSCEALRACRSAVFKICFNTWKIVKWEIMGSLPLVYFDTNSFVFYSCKFCILDFYLFQSISTLQYWYFYLNKTFEYLFPQLVSYLFVANFLRQCVSHTWGPRGQPENVNPTINPPILISTQLLWYNDSSILKISNSE